jgi:predicted nucleic acid-binding protein
MRTNLAFWDSSALIPLCCFQQTTHSAHRIRRQFQRVVAWWGTSVEIRSGISRLGRESAIDNEEKHLAVRQWNTILEGIDLIAPSEKLLGVAVELPETYSIRAMDAFQLAAALVWCAERPRNRPFITADRRLGEAASDAGFDVISLN